jgi:predicted glycogen debranching enzyme
MIALPGLCLGGGEARDARAILGEWAGHVRDGLLPNRFPEESEEAEYHAADAALWMVIAVHRYLEATGDRAFVRARLAAAVQHVVEGYRAGTRHGIRMDADGLVEQGEPGLQLTWMDARVDGRVITPRAGLAVEIQALWYNALLIAAALAADAGRARRAFLRLFWSDEHGYLADVVGPGGRDLSLRPNQLYAIALPHALVPREIAASVLARVRRDLLTPVGLRTLAPWDQAYVGRYAGDARSRDGAYHQGTVWPFLMGAYFDAAVRMEGEPAKREAREWLAAFAPHVERDAGLGFVSEVFDGDAPHRPGGAIAQAWSVAELLRVALRLDERIGGSRRGPARREPAPGSSARRSQPGSSSQASPDQHISQKHPS